MTTSHSPLRLLKAQADKIAAMLKASERGDVVNPNIQAARTRDGVKFAVAMDDKILEFEMTWATIRESSEFALAAFVLKHMRSEREAS